MLDGFFKLLAGVEIEKLVIIAFLELIELIRRSGSDG